LRQSRDPSALTSPQHLVRRPAAPYARAMPQASPASPAPLPAATVRGYALGGVASGTFGTVPGILLMPYLTDVIGISAALAGLVVFVPKAWDFLLNPVAGRISDRSTNPAGRRRPFL